MIAIRAQHAQEPRSSLLRTSLVWLPLVVLVVLLAASATTARGIVPSAGAASTIDVTGLVDELVYLDATGCSTPSSLALGDLVTDDPWKRTAADCSIMFGSSNSALGADLQVLEDPAAPAAPTDAMKCIVASCSGGSYDGAINDAPVNSVAPTTSASAFGLQLEGAAGTAAPVWTVGRANPASAASTACNTTGIGDGTCNFRFGASSNATDGPGAYQAQVQFIVLAR
ncbi:MAG: hypothetical protein JWM86_1932 [Thermoleophilia bacterium]|nr:hypothetical protein [Thermoleophilia bacterium]